MECGVIFYIGRSCMIMRYGKYIICVQIKLVQKNELIRKQVHSAFEIT